MMMMMMVVGGCWRVYYGHECKTSQTHRATREETYDCSLYRAASGTKVEMHGQT